MLRKLFKWYANLYVFMKELCKTERSLPLPLRVTEKDKTEIRYFDFLLVTETDTN